MTRTSDWPLSDTVRMPASRAPARRGRRRFHAAWAIGVAAFVCGALVSAAAFSVGWRHQAQRGSSAEAALAVATAKNHSLTASLAAARAAATRSEAQAAAARKARAWATAAADAGSAAALTSYLGTTPSAQLDAGYVASQTAYIAKQLDRIGAERSDLAAAIAGFDAVAKKLADRASTLSGRN
jgi:hypothetical protein